MNSSVVLHKSVKLSVKCRTTLKCERTLFLKFRLRQVQRAHRPIVAEAEAQDPRAQEALQPAGKRGVDRKWLLFVQLWNVYGSVH